LWISQDVFQKQKWDVGKAFQNLKISPTSKTFDKSDCQGRGLFLHLKKDFKQTIEKVKEDLLPEFCT